MKSYLVKLLSALAIVVIAHVTIILTVPAIISAEYWVRETIVVKEAIAASLPSPRIIFLAGSSTMFGVDAKQVEEGTGLPTVNFGLRGGMQLSRLLKIGEDVVRPGDVLVLGLERAYYVCGQDNWSPWLLRNSIAWDRDYFNSLPLRQRVELALSQSDSTLAFEVIGDYALSSVFPGMYQKRLAAIAPPDQVMKRFRSGAELPSTFAYSAFNMDDRGTTLHTQGSFAVDPASMSTVLIPAAICPDTLKTLRQFVATMKARRVRVIFSHSPIMVEGRPDKEWPQAETLFARDIHAIGSELLEDRQVVFFPRPDFFNFFEHLNEAARRRRTVQIIADLKRLGVARK